MPVVAYSVDERSWLEVAQDSVQDALLNKPRAVPLEFIFNSETTFQSERQPSVDYFKLAVQPRDIPQLIRKITRKILNYLPGEGTIRYGERVISLSEAQGYIFRLLWEEIIEGGRAALSEEEIFRRIPRRSGSNRINDIFKTHPLITLGILKRIGPRRWTISLPTQPVQ